MEAIIKLKYPNYRSFRILDSLQIEHMGELAIEGWDILEIIPNAAQRIVTLENRTRHDGYNDPQKGSWNPERYETRTINHKLSVSIIVLGKCENSRIEELNAAIGQKTILISEHISKIDKLEEKCKKAEESNKKAEESNMVLKTELERLGHQLLQDRTRNAKECEILKNDKAKLSEEIECLKSKLVCLKELMLSGTKEIPQNQGEQRDISLD